MLPVIQSLWIGSQLSKLEQLTVASFLAHGHPFHLFVYDEVEGVPTGATLRDANEIVPQSQIFKSRGSYAAFSDLFRWTLAWQTGSFWVDMDVVCLAPFDFANELVFAKEESDKLATAVLRFPKGHGFCGRMIERCRHPNRFRSGDGRRTKLRKLVRRYLRGDSMANIDWGETGGPAGFSEEARACGLLSQALPYYAFYPIHYTNWDAVFDGSFSAGDELISGSFGLHWWNDCLSRAGVEKNQVFPPGSMIERLKSRYL